MRKLRPLLLAVTAWGTGLACGPRPMPAGYAGDDVRAFVSQHRAELEGEIALGSGPELYDLSIVAGCQDVPEVGRRLHKSHQQIFAPATLSDAEVSERIVGILSRTPELRCLGLDLSRESALSAGRRHVGPGRHQLSVLRRTRWR